MYLIKVSDLQTQVKSVQYMSAYIKHLPKYVAQSTKGRPDDTKT